MRCGGLWWVGWGGGFAGKSGTCLSSTTGPMTMPPGMRFVDRYSFALIKVVALTLRRQLRLSQPVLLRTTSKFSRRPSALFFAGTNPGDWRIALVSEHYV